MRACERWVANDFLARQGLPLEQPCDHDPTDCPLTRPDRSTMTDHTIIDETRGWRTLDTTGAINVKPCITIRATYRQLGPGVEELEVSWDAGTYFPAASELLAVVDALRRPATEEGS